MDQCGLANTPPGDQTAAFDNSSVNSFFNRILLESREEIKFNVEAVDLLIRAQLVNMREFDIHMAQVSVSVQTIDGSTQ